MTAKTFSMGSHDNCITVGIIRLFQNFLGWKPFTHLYGFNLTGIFWITIEFFITEYFQPVPDSIESVRGSFIGNLFP